MMIQSADLTLYDENDDSIEIPLSPMQLEMICRILGIKNTDSPNTIRCYSDATLRKMLNMKGNPLTLKPVKQEEK